jgi:toxin secretion/phage lysis holin
MNNLIDSLKDSLDGQNKQGLWVLTSSVVAYVFGGMSYLLPILLILMVIDYLSGLLAAIVTEKRFSAKTALRGAAKKMAYILFVVLAQLLDAVVAAVNYTGILHIENFHYLGFIVNIYLIGTEGLSIAQNAAACGIPIPKPLSTFFKKIEKITEGGEETEHETDLEP